MDLTDPATGPDIVSVREGASAPVALVATDAQEGRMGVGVSPNGRWLAYVSDVTGTDEVWVRPYLESDAPVRVSQSGGREPV